LECSNNDIESDKNWMDYKKWDTKEYEDNYKKIFEMLE
jgi:hypothetical protein